MSHQKRHIRRSKFGRRFVAGRGKYEVWVGRLKVFTGTKEQARLRRQKILRDFKRFREM